MRRLVLLAVMLALALAAPPALAAPGAVLYVDDDPGCNGKTPCYPHPQDAVNAAAPGSTIRVYPGTYGSRYSDCGWANCSCNDSYAPALIVYKDGLTIEAIDPDPAATVIEATHACWSNPGAVVASTAGGVTPAFGSEPNAVSIIANDVVLRGFTVLRPYSSTAGGHHAILIGGLYQGYGMDGEAFGFYGNTVSNCVMGSAAVQNYNGVTIWHSSNNVIAGNTVIDTRETAIEIFDGASRAEVKLPHPSQGNRIHDNVIQDNTGTWSLGEAVFVGIYYSSPPANVSTNNSGTEVYRNDCGGWDLFTAYSNGVKKFYDNTNVRQMRVIEATGVFYDGKKFPN